MELSSDTCLERLGRIGMRRWRMTVVKGGREDFGMGNCFLDAAWW